MTTKHRGVLFGGVVCAILLGGAVSAFLLHRHQGSPAYQIGHGRAEKKIWAIRELAKKPTGPETWQTIARTMTDADTMVRMAAVGALKASADRIFVPDLSRMAMADPETPVRAAAVDSLAALGGDEAWKTVLAFLQAEEGELRAVAVECAGRYGRRETVATLRIMKREDPSQEVRDRARAVLQALAPNPPPTTPVDLSGKSLFFEAEHGVRMRRNFEWAPSRQELLKGTKGEVKDPALAGIENHSGYGWIRALQGAGGRANYWGGDFLCTDIGKIDYPIHLPAAGNYDLWFRVWWMDDCGNSLFAWFDDMPETDFSSPEAEDDNQSFRKWYWHQANSNLRLSAGAHTLHLEVCEDGIQVDAIALQPANAPPPQGCVPANINPLAWAPPGVEVQWSCESEVMDSSGNLYVTLWVLRQGPDPLEGVVTLDTGQGVPQGGRTLAVRLEDDDYVFSRDLVIAYGASEPCRESLVRATFISTNGQHKASTSMIVQKSWPWEYAGPYREKKALDSILSDPHVTWRTIPPEKIYGRYGVMNFEKALGNGTHGYMYLRTRVRLPEDTSIRWLLQADDTADVWMDGRPLISERHQMPLEASLSQVFRQESKGEHVIVVESFQTATPDKGLFDTQNYWSLRFRARADYHTPANLEGIRYE